MIFRHVNPLIYQFGEIVFLWMLSTYITNHARWRGKKPTTTVFLHYSIEMEFEGSTRSVLNVTKVARSRYFWTWTKITTATSEYNLGYYQM